MSYYRLYFIKDDQFFECEEFEALGDAEAVQKARKLQGGLPAELWQQTRKVQEFEAPEAVR